MLPQNGPSDREVARYTDHYFTRTRKAIGRFGDVRVTYALFYAAAGLFRGPA